jgi:ERF superfamily
MAQDITNPGPQDSMLAGLERLARDTSIATDRITELFRLAERREQTLLKRVFNEDMTALQTVITQIMRDKPNPAFTSRYATEEQIDRAARPEYTRFGFSIRFGTEKPEIPGNIRVVCIIAHRSGYFEEHALEAPAVPANRGVTQLQAVGGTVTYLKRTLIRMVLNLVTSDNPEDNDGNGHKDTGAGGPKNTTAHDYLEVVAQFEAAAERIKDSDEARKLLEWKPGVVALTALPHGDARQHYMVLRSLVQRKWLSKPDDGSSASEDAIEGL